MEGNVLKLAHAKRNCSSVKVHDMMCTKLSKILNKIIKILPGLEDARPGSTIGIKTLCSLNTSIEKGKLIIQHCTESSKLYLALTSKTILGRCERVKSSLIQNLSQIQSMVPLPLASKVSNIIKYLENAKFEINPREEEAGEAILNLLSLENSSEELESNALQIAASNLNLSSPKSILIEKRSIRRLLDQIKDIDPTKESVLNFLLSLITKYGKNIRQGSDKIEEIYEINYEYISQDLNSNSVSSLQNVCLSLLEGKIKNYDNSHTDFSDLSDNSQTDYSDLSKSSQTDFSDLLNNLPKIEDQSEICSHHLFPWNADYITNGTFSGFDPDKFVNFLKDLSLLKREKREKAVEDLKMVLEREIETCYLMLSNGFGEGLIQFLKISHHLSDEISQNIGAQLFLAFLRNNRVEFPTLSEEILKILQPFLDQETREALSILQKFSQYFNNSPSKDLSSEDINIMEICMEMLLDISCTQNSITKTQIFSSGYLNSLASILSLEKLTECSLKVLQITSCLQEGAILITQNPKFISCLVEFLETGRSDEKEISLNILHNLCAEDPKNCLIVVNEGVIPALVLLSVNGNECEMEMSIKLLQLLRDLRDDDCEINSTCTGTESCTGTYTGRESCTGTSNGTESCTGTSTGTESCTSEKFVSKPDPFLVKKKGVLSKFGLFGLF